MSDRLPVRSVVKSVSVCMFGFLQSQWMAYWLAVEADRSSIPALELGTVTFVSARREHAYRLALNDFRWKS